MRRRSTSVAVLPDELASVGDVMEALRAYAKETGKKPLMLGGWEVEHPTIAPPPGLLRRLSEGRLRLRQYTHASDLRHAREAASDLFGGSIRFAGSPITERHVSIQQNSTQALLLALAALKERGARRVVIAAPAYFAVETICRSLGLDMVVVPASDFLTGALDITRLVDAARLPGSVALVTNPAYSVGVEYGAEALNTLARELPPYTWLLLDETRLGLSWREAAPWRRTDLPQRAIIIRSPSKIFFIHGRKLSLLVADLALVREIEQLGEALVGSLAGDLASVALAYLEYWRQWRDEAAAADAGPMMRWRSAALAALQENLAAAECALAPAGFHLSPVDSGPYTLAAVPRDRLAHLGQMEAALRLGVLVMDGRYFLHKHPAWQGFRINLCGAPPRQTEALARLLAFWRQMSALI